MVSNTIALWVRVCKIGPMQDSVSMLIIQKALLFPSCDILKWLPVLKIHERDQLSVNGGAWLLVALWRFRAITLQWFKSGQALEWDLVAGMVHTSLSA